MAVAVQHQTYPCDQDGRFLQKNRKICAHKISFLTKELSKLNAENELSIRKPKKPTYHLAILDSI